MPSPERSRLSPLVLLALLAGTVLRTVAVFRRPLWADETFTLWLSRKSFGEIFATLHVDSGPPLHYLLSKLVLLPFPQPGHGDVAVRLVSLLASLLHFPLLLSVGRKLGDARIGARAATLFALFPLAIDFAAEGRAYAVASLLALAALDRALAARESGRWRDAALLALCGAGAALTHYLAVLPVAALALLLPRASAAGRRALAGGLVGAGLLFSPWLPFLLNQPRASMAWSAGTPRGEALARFFANLASGTDPGGPFILPLAVAGALLIGAALFTRRTLAGPVLLGGVALLFLLQAVTGTAILPQRSAMPLLPLAALVLAAAAPAALVSLAVSVVALAARVLAPPVVSPGEELANALVTLARRGETVCAPGLWGPELDYRLAARGAPGRVVLFPSEVTRHRGWFRDDAADRVGLAAEAEALLSRPGRPRVYVIPFAGRAGAALSEEISKRSATLFGRTPLFEVWLAGTGVRQDSETTPRDRPAR